jgi:hypothetical protein
MKRWQGDQQALSNPDCRQLASIGCAVGLVSADAQNSSSFLDGATTCFGFVASHCFLPVH